MIEQFFWPKTDWQQPRAGSLENQAHSRKQGMPEEAGTYTSRTRAWGAASGAQNPRELPFPGLSHQTMCESQW